MNAPDLSSLISTRICHDLVNPIGAISNGIELMEELQSNDSPEFGLITDSIASANAKLGFFRIAFGEAREGSELPIGLAAKTLGTMYESGRFRARWTAQNDPVLRSHVKLIFLLVQCVESSLPLGGNCSISQQDNVWLIDGTGARVSPNADLWKIATNRSDNVDLSASEVHFAVAAQCAIALDCQIEMTSGEAGIAVKVIFKP
jgi:histidine phosphotransferase ChpT